MRRFAALTFVPLLAAASPAGEAPQAAPAPSAAMRWKINTHLYAANIALADALNDGMVTIAPFGEFPVAPAALSALRTNPAAYRAGVLAPDLFPDMYVGGWFIHSDLTQGDGWIANDWLTHVWSRARSWSDASERDKVMAFAYGFVTHGAGDMFAHTWVNAKANGAWVSFWGKDRETAFKHIVLEGYVGDHTPPSDLNIDVWPRFVSNVLIKDPLVRPHSKSVPHYKHFLAIYDALEPLIDKAKSQMNANIRDDAPYWAKCAANPVPCMRKEQMETWRLDINRGLRAIVDSSETLGEKLMDGEGGDGFGAMTGWAKEWLPKMYGVHALGEGTKAFQEFVDWADKQIPWDEQIKAEVEKFIEKNFKEYWEIYEAAKNPATYMEARGMFPPGTKLAIDGEMGVKAGGQWLNWHEFEPLYNTVTLSKLALLNGDGLNELARRAGLSAPIFPAGDNTNIMLGVFRSMTQSYQWVGDVVRSDTGSARTEFGICGPENTRPLPPDSVCGLPYSARGSVPTSKAPRAGPEGFALWGNPQAREKIFKVIFKGFGPGPGTPDLRSVAELSPQAAAPVRTGRRALRSATGETEYMRELVAVMQGKVNGGASQVLARPSAPSLRQPAAPIQSGVPISNWGQRCCSKDVAELRAALARLQSSNAQLQSTGVASRFGRRQSITQVTQRVGLISGALNSFADARDATVATAALAYIANHVEALAAIVAGNQ